MESENGIFRKKSLDRIQSPEKLDDYIKVASPGVWLILTAVILLLVGVCCWGIFGRMDTRINAVVMSNGYYCYAAVDSEKIDSVKVGDEVTAEDRVYTVAEINTEPVELTLVDSSYLLRLLGKNADTYVCLVLLSDTYVKDEEIGTDILEAGAYKASILVDSVSPISFVVR